MLYARLFLFLACLIGAAFGNSVATTNGIDDPTPVIVTKAGYPTETHYTTTDDGYILEIHRIPHGKGQEPGNGSRPAVFLMHGLMCSSADWVLMGPEKSLGFMLADAGYDVWIGNFRGNTYSRNHLHLDPSNIEFWKFSWDQHADHDLPSMINYVVAYTSQDKIFYAGHSMGTTTFMAMATNHPEVQEHIALANLLAPVAYVGHMKSPIRYLAPLNQPLEVILEWLGVGEFVPNNFVTKWLSDLACKDSDVLQEICHMLLFSIMGFDQSQLNVTLLDTIGHHTPAGTSTYTVLQYAQEVNSNGFYAFDYGKDRNKEIYGTPYPPEYEISKITAPVAIYWGDNDWLAQPNDVLRLTSQLPNMKLSYEVPYPQFNHMDFLYAIDAPTLLYQKVMEQMEATRRNLD